MSKAGIELVAGKLLDQEGQADVRTLLEEGNFEGAREGMLENIDAHWQIGKISDGAAAEFYRCLGYTPEQVCQLRQRRVAAWLPVSCS